MEHLDESELVANAERFFHLYTLENILVEPDYSKKRTKMICTIGPACDSVETLVKMIDLGMNCARLNFSHGDHKSHGKTVDNLKEAFRLRRNVPVSILLDTKGPGTKTQIFL
jgi:pyruvate kinase